MHPEIKKFWEESNGRVWVQTEPNLGTGVTNVPAYWFDKNDSKERLLIACPFGADLNGNPKMAYYIASGWVTEDIMLKYIKLKAYL